MFACCARRALSTRVPLHKAKTLWKSAQAVCFDVDSTVITTEGIDELAKVAGVDVSAITARCAAPPAPHSHVYGCGVCLCAHAVPSPTCVWAATGP